MIRHIFPMLIRKRTFCVKAQGNSMLPLFHPGDVVYVKKIHLSKIKKDDIIFVYKDKKPMIHRVIYIAYHSNKKIRYFITKGDNNPHSDGKVYPRNIYGVVYQIKQKNQIFKMDELYLIQSSLYFNEILKIKKAFEKNKIDFLFLKGLPLHFYYEKKYPGRLFADCDILARIKDEFKIKKIFQNCKYTAEITEYSKTHKKLKDKLTEITLFKIIHGFPVTFDIHFEPVFLMNQIGKINALYPDYLMEKMTELFLKEKCVINYRENTYPILSPVNLITYLSLHFFHHNFRQIYRLSLLNYVLKSIPNTKKSDFYNNLAQTIHTFKIEGFVYPSFILLKKYTNSGIPDNFIKEIKPDESKVKYIKKNILNINVFNTESRITAGINRFKNIFFLSPNSLLKKFLILFNIQVTYSLYWTAKMKIKNMTIGRLRRLNQTKESVGHS